MRNLSGWGRYPVIPATELFSEDLERSTRGAVLTRGMGRSYGDSSLPPPGRGSVASSRLADRVLAFDDQSGVLRAEAGLPLSKINELFWPRGWTTPITPGTQQVTLGGMVAADVHGKNHHEQGCFGEHVCALRMRVADGRVLEVSEESQPELFRATLGGMGLTGHILEVECRMHRIPTPWIWQESEWAESLAELLDLLGESSRDWPFTVAWADALAGGADLGRGIVIRGRWAEPQEAPPELPRPKGRVAVPFEMPTWLLNRWSLQAFNLLNFHKHGRGVRRDIVHPETFFYPLDGIHDWNLLYGSFGFTQYQCVLPRDAGADYPRRLLEEMTRHRADSFLTVIKDCGEEGKGMLSFPRTGTSVALDIPIRPRRTQAAVDAMNEVVIDCGGRVYLAKDAFTRSQQFRRMEPRLEAWREVRRRWDPDGRIVSAQSVRLLGDRP
jgi:FAD/FMN-containing dehydrogenase